MLLKFKEKFVTDQSTLLDYIVDNIANTEIRNSKIHGLGLFATAPIQAGYCLAIMDGQIVDYDFYNRVKNELELAPDINDYLFMEWNSLPDNKLLSRMFRTKYGYINHSRSPNCKMLGNPPKLWSYHDINCDDEITLDYRLEPLPDNYIMGHGSTYL